MSDKTISLTFSGKEEILKNKWTTKKRLESFLLVWILKTFQNGNN